MKGFLIICLSYLALDIPARAQPYFASLHRQLLIAKDDTSRVLALCNLAEYHQYIQSDSNLFYVNKAIELSQKIDYRYGQYLALFRLFNKELFGANYTRALEIALDILKIAATLPTDKLYYMALAHGDIANVSLLMGDRKKQSEETDIAWELQKKSGKMDGDWWGQVINKRSLFLPGQPDSALYYAHRGSEMAKQSVVIGRTFMCLATAILSNTYQQLGNFSMARHYYEIALEQCETYNNVYIKARVYRDLAGLFKIQGNIDSCLHFAQLSLALCDQYNFGDYKSQVSQILATVYESQLKPDSALKYFKVMLAARDSIFSQAKVRQFQLSLFNAVQKQREAEQAREKYQSMVRLYASLAAVFVFILLSAILYRNNRQKQKAYMLISQQKQETDTQRTRVEEAYQELKSTQAQLIQSEKMASLGELTAGIAHEIQNPLNFVNNFSELNSELIDEMEKALFLDQNKEALQLARDIKLNEDKINHHGKRADAIVKGMLLHSRESRGQKESIDINMLADEYLKLSYQGFKSRDSAFNATLTDDFDPTIGNINVIPQDIARVLINLYNNAYYAVSEKKKQMKQGFEPLVRVITKKYKDKVEIRVRDNGFGIPQKVMDKIFQPFFTTKPTGQGTGLGLSLSYDIITKEHGGTLTVDTREGEYAEFIIQLPIV